MHASLALLLTCLAPWLWFAQPEPASEDAVDYDAADAADAADGDEPAMEVDSKRRVGVDGDAELRESVYADDDDTVISTTSVDATVTPGEAGVTLRAGYLADVISSASVDVVSAATGRWTELRNQGSGGVGLERGLWQADVGYTFSDENDWTSHTGSATLGRDFFERNTNISAGYIFVYNKVFRADDDNFRDKMLTHAANLSLTQVLGKRTNMRLSGFFSANGGFQSSPYRYVPVGVVAGATADPAGTCLNAVSCPLERHPRERYRYALAGSLIHYVGRKKPASVRVDYRFYGDSWEVFSHTVSLSYRLEFARRWEFRARSRTYFQDHAYFYEERYDAPRQFLTVDRELGTFIHQLTGLKLTFKTGMIGKVEDVRIDLKGDVFYFKFFDFVRLPQRIGGVVELGFRLVF